MKKWHIFLLVLLLIIVLIGGVVILFWHKKVKEGETAQEGITQGDTTEAMTEAPLEEVQVGELLEYRFSPGYSDMNGASHHETLTKDDNGNWVIISRDRDDMEDPMVETTYAVSDEDVANLDAFIKENNVLGLMNRPESDDFMTDYSPWGYGMVYNNSSLGGSEHEIYGIDEYHKYTHSDYELMEELDKLFKDIHGEKISEVTESEDE